MVEKNDDKENMDVAKKETQELLKSLKLKEEKSLLEAKQKAAAEHGLLEDGEEESKNNGRQ